MNESHYGSHLRRWPSAWGGNVPISAWDWRGNPFGTKTSSFISGQEIYLIWAWSRKACLSQLWAESSRLEDPYQSRAPVYDSKLVTPSTVEKGKPCFLEHIVGRACMRRLGAEKWEIDLRPSKHESRSEEEKYISKHRWGTLRREERPVVFPKELFSASSKQALWSIAQAHTWWKKVLLTLCWLNYLGRWCIGGFHLHSSLLSPALWPGPIPLPTSPAIMG